MSELCRQQITVARLPREQDNLGNGRWVAVLFSAIENPAGLDRCVAAVDRARIDD